jgi:hypothetical protein
VGGLVWLWRQPQEGRQKSMVDKLENFMNWLTDMDWGWWPILFLRPPKDQEMDNLVLLKMTPFFGSVVGILFLLVVVFGATGIPTSGNIIFALILCVLVGWILFFVIYKLTFAYFWNRRARRLRHHHE